METIKITSDQLSSISKYGKLIEVCSIEDISIVSFYEKDFDSKKLTENVCYFVFYNGKQINEYFRSLPTALAFACSVKMGTRRSEFAYGFVKMVTVDSI